MHSVEEPIYWEKTFLVRRVVDKVSTTHKDAVESPEDFSTETVGHTASPHSSSLLDEGED